MDLEMLRQAKLGNAARLEREALVIGGGRARGTPMTGAGGCLRTGTTGDARRG